MLRYKGVLLGKWHIRNALDGPGIVRKGIEFRCSYAQGDGFRFLGGVFNSFIFDLWVCSLLARAPEIVRNHHRRFVATPSATAPNVCLEESLINEDRGDCDMC